MKLKHNDDRGKISGTPILRIFGYYEKIWFKMGLDFRARTVYLENVYILN